MLSNTIVPKTGRPAGVRSGSGKGTGRVKMMFGLYKGDRDRLKDLSEKYDLSYAGIVRLSLLILEGTGDMLKTANKEALSLETGLSVDDCSDLLEILSCKRQD